MQECIGCGRRGFFPLGGSSLVDNNSSHFNAWEAENMSEDPAQENVERDANSIDFLSEVPEEIRNRIRYCCS